MDSNQFQQAVKNLRTQIWVHFWIAILIGVQIVVGMTHFSGFTHGINSITFDLIFYSSPLLLLFPMILFNRNDIKISTIERFLNTFILISWFYAILVILRYIWTLMNLESGWSWFWVFIFLFLPYMIVPIMNIIMGSKELSMCRNLARQGNNTE